MRLPLVERSCGVSLGGGMVEWWNGGMVVGSQMLARAGIEWWRIWERGGEANKKKAQVLYSYCEYILHWAGRWSGGPGNFKVLESQVKERKGKVRKVIDRVRVHTYSTHRCYR